MPTVPQPTTYSGHLNAAGKRFALVCARFNHFIVDQLEMGAIDTLLRHGASLGDIAVYRVPGAWELPLAVKRVAETGKFDAVVALGAVIRGSTPHFDYVSAECVKGMAAVQMSSALPVTFGVLTTDTIEQAIERAGTKAGNHGFKAAMSALEMASLFGRLDG